MTIAIVASGTFVAGASLVALGGDRDMAIAALALALLASLETAYAYSSSLGGMMAVLGEISGVAVAIIVITAGILLSESFHELWFQDPQQ